MIIFSSDFSISPTEKRYLKKIVKSFLREKSEIEIFYDMCFCLMTPQTKYEYNRIAINNLIENDFYSKNLPLDSIDSLIWKTRFHRIKAQRLILAKAQFNTIFSIVTDNELDWFQKRSMLVAGVKGFGMKTSSHFLRNVGALDLAIIDTHILKYMGWQQPKNNKDYVEKEKMFLEESKRRGLTPVELDSYIWKIYSGTQWRDFIY
jgi:N-glycosylase/DNA lyase